MYRNPCPEGIPGQFHPPTIRKSEFSERTPLMKTIQRIDFIFNISS